MNDGDTFLSGKGANTVSLRAGPFIVATPEVVRDMRYAGFQATEQRRYRGKRASQGSAYRWIARSKVVELWNVVNAEATSNKARKLFFRYVRHDPSFMASLNAAARVGGRAGWVSVARAAFWGWVRKGCPLS